MTEVSSRHRSMKRQFRFEKAGWAQHEATPHATTPDENPRLSVHQGLRLRHRPGTALAPDSPDGSLGGLILPRGMAMDPQRRLFLLNSDGAVCAFDGPGEISEAKKLFVPILHLGRHRGEGLHRQVWPSIAIAGKHLFGLRQDRSPRLVAYDLVTGQLRALPELLDDVVDIAAHEDRVFVLTSSGKLERLAADEDSLRDQPPPAFETIALRTPNEAKPTFSRLAVDRDGRFVLLGQTNNDEEPQLWIFAADGAHQHTTEDPQELRSCFEWPWIRCDENLRFLVPDFLWNAFVRTPDEGRTALYADDPHGLDGRLAVRIGEQHSKRLFGFDTSKTDPYDPTFSRTEPIYERSGIWESHRLDSGIYRCNWGRAEIVVRNLPPGAKVVVSSYTTDEHIDRPYQEAGAVAVDPNLWQEFLSFTRAEVERSDGTAEDARIDGLVGGRHGLEGRFLFLRVEILGDGYQSGFLKSMTVRFPQDNYSQYLPGIYRAERESRVLLERFLAIPQATWDPIEDAVVAIPNMLDPDTVEAGPALRFLASWVGAPVELADDDRVQRRMLKATIATLADRGTSRAIREMVAAFARPLVEVEGTDPKEREQWESESLPVVVEGYQYRDLVVLNAANSHRLNEESKLNPTGPESALRIGESSVIGGSRLLPGRGMDALAFGRFAHRFDVHVPAAWVVRHDLRRRLETLIEREKPGHTDGRIRIVHAGLRVGEQSMLGVDTLLGDFPRTWLGTDPITERRGPWLGRDVFLAPAPRYPQEFPVVQEEEKP